MNNSVFEAYLQPCLAESNHWQQLQEGLTQLREHYSRRHFFYLFALCARWFKGQKVVPPLEASIEHYELVQHWQGPELARVLLLTYLPRCVAADEYQAAVNELFQSADVNELRLLVQSLPLLPKAEAFTARAREAARSNIEQVFCAIAHHSEYACRNFDVQGWNQLVLKAAFMAVPIWPIKGLRERNNRQLVSMLKNYALERQAAARPVPWDLYCCIGWLVSNAQHQVFLIEQYRKATGKAQLAIRLALLENEQPAAQALARELAVDAPPVQTSWQAIASMED